MARKSKKKTGKSRVESSADEPIPTIDDLDQPVDELASVDGIEDAKVVASTDDYIEASSNDVLTEDVVTTESADSSYNDSYNETTATPPPAVEKSGGGFFPLLIGGLVAGGIGYGVSYFQWANQGSSDTALADQAAAISALEEKIAALPAPTDIGPLEGQVADVAASVGSIDTAVADLNTTVTNLDTAVVDLGQQFTAATGRIDELERRPNSDGTFADTAIAAFESDLDVLREEMAAQQATLGEELTAKQTALGEEMTAQQTALSEKLATQREELQAMVAAASQQLEATREEAISIEENAVATARKATARTVLTQVQEAMDTGTPLGALLSDLDGALDEPIPDALTAVSDGVPTLDELKASYPEQARAALSIARSEGVDGEETSGFGSFLRNQLDVRSVEPQDGDSANAILSRVEANVNDGQLNDALAEIAGLPEVVRGALSDWVGQAELRAAALDAVATLSDTLNIN